MYGEQRSKIQELFSWFETNNTQRVFRWYRNPKNIEFKYDVPYRTIKNWIAKTRHDIDVIVDHRTGSNGRPKSRNFITIHINDYKLSNLCAALAISRRTYYKYRDREDPDYYKYLLIKEIFDES